MLMSTKPREQPDVSPCMLDPNLDVILDHLVAEEQHVPAAGDRCAELGHAAYRQLRLCLC